MASEELLHLNDITREKLTWTNEQRIDDIRKGYWIPHPDAIKVLDQLEILYHHPKIQRMPCQFVESATNNGKSRIIDIFMERHPAEDNLHGEQISIPIIFVETPGSARDGDLYDEILRALNAPFRASAKDPVKYGMVIEYVEKLGAKMLFLDEIHNITVARQDLQRSFLYTLKKLNNRLRMPIVAVGAREALRAFQTSEEVANRFVPISLPRWKNDDNFRRLLKSFEMKLPLGKPSNLVEPELASLILSFSEGTIGEIYRLLSDAAILSIKNGDERITKKLIGTASKNSPSERKKKAYR